MRSKKRRYRTPKCQKQGKKRYEAWAVRREPKARFYWCRVCKCYHKTTQPPGIASSSGKRGLG